MTDAGRHRAHRDGPAFKDGPVTAPAKERQDAPAARPRVAAVVLVVVLPLGYLGAQVVRAVVHGFPANAPHSQPFQPTQEVQP